MRDEDIDRIEDYGKEQTKDVGEDMKGTRGFIAEPQRTFHAVIFPKETLDFHMLCEYMPGFSKAGNFLRWHSASLSLESKFNIVTYWKEAAKKLPSVAGLY